MGGLSSSHQRHVVNNCRCEPKENGHLGKQQFPAAGYPLPLCCQEHPGIPMMQTRKQAGSFMQANSACQTLCCKHS